jgi:hypothetical protein
MTIRRHRSRPRDRTSGWARPDTGTSPTGAVPAADPWLPHTVPNFAARKGGCAAHGLLMRVADTGASPAHRAPLTAPSDAWHEQAHEPPGTGTLPAPATGDAVAVKNFAFAPATRRWASRIRAAVWRS